MKKFILILFSVLLLGNTSFGQELKEQYLFHNDWIREYLIYIPSTYNEDEPAPLVFVLHGLGADNENMLGVGMNDYAEEKGYIVVYPNALLSPLGTAWSNGTILNTNIDDVDFVRALIDTVSITYNINERRIYSCGFSMGGIMSQRLACELSDRLAAIASNSGPFATYINNNCVPNRKMPVLYLHGTADETVPYSGQVLYGISSAMTTFHKWGVHNECGDEVIIEQVPDTANTEYHVDRYTFAGCDPEAEVIHYRIWGWPHRWPRTGSNIDATAEMVKFFERHSLPEAEDVVLTPVENSLIDDLTSVGPNPFNSRLELNFQPAFDGGWHIYDASGKLVDHGTQSKVLDTQHWQAGIYLLSVKQDLETAAYKLIRH